MKTRRNMLCVAAAAVGCAALRAPGATITFTCESGNWNNADCWDLDRPPQDGDHVVIPTGRTCTVNITGAECDSFDVDGTLNIDTGKELTIDANSTVDGLVVLKGLNSELTMTLPANGANRVISGTGQIKGEHSGAKLLPNPNAGGDLISQVDITGTLTLAGNGKFANEGRVIADAGGTLFVGVLGGLRDTTGDRWFVSNGASLLYFVDELPTEIDLAGNWVIDDDVSSTGGIRVDRALLTTGRLQMAGGLLDLRANVTMGSDGASPKHMLATGGKITAISGAKFEHK